MKKKFWKSILSGVISGLPLGHRITKVFPGLKSAPTLATDGGEPGSQTPEPPKFDYLALLLEASTITILILFATNKLSFEQLKELLAIFGVQQ